MLVCTFIPEQQQLLVVALPCILLQRLQHRELCKSGREIMDNPTVIEFYMSVNGYCSSTIRAGAAVDRMHDYKYGGQRKKDRSSVITHSLIVTWCGLEET